MRLTILTALAFLVGLPALLLGAIQLGMINIDPRQGNRRLNPSTIDIARSQKLLVAQPSILTPMMTWQGKKYPIRQVWLEQVVDEDMFFQRTIIGHQIKVQVENIRVFPWEPSWENARMVCNQTIEFRTALKLDDQTVLWFANVTEPLPRSVSCEIKANQ
jgi:hypothetical protein